MPDAIYTTGVKDIMKRGRAGGVLTPRRRPKRARQLWLFVLPAAAMVFIFNYIPMYGVVMAFQDYAPGRGFLHSPWVGMEHFIRFFRSYSSSSTIRNLCCGRFPPPSFLRCC